jgi:23S rRNA pseudouridine2604 synthase
MCGALGFSVLELKRIRLMNLKLGTLREGMKRFLTREEIAELKKMAGISS